MKSSVPPYDHIVLSDALRKRAFDIGWDYASYAGLRPPEDSPPEIWDGYQEGMQRRVGPLLQHDRYIRKWLLLRANALRRGREVSDEVTPTYLRKIERPFCPVTMQPLTYGEGTETDWSVDRANNNAGYAAGNLVIISAKANQAKGARGLIEMLQATEKAMVSLQGTYRGLTRKQWLRLAALTMGPCLIDEPIEPILPQCTIIPYGSLVLSNQLVQYRLVLNTIGMSDAGIMTLRKIGGASNAKRFRRMIDKLQRNTPRVPFSKWHEVSPFDVWLDMGIFQMFCDWCDELSAREVETCLCRKWNRNISSNIFEQSRVSQWALDRFGYAA